MRRTPFPLFRTALLVFAIALATGLGASGALPADIEPGQHAFHGESSSSKFVEQVGVATDIFRQTIPDEYKQFLGCVSGPEVGAMGVHFVNFDLVDGKPEVNHPGGSDLRGEERSCSPGGRRVHRPGGRVASRGGRAAGPGAGRAAVPLHREPEPFRSARVLRAPCVGVARQSERNVRGLESARLL
jgi:hypothetical protein